MRGAAYGPVDLSLQPMGAPLLSNKIDLQEISDPSLS